MDDSFQKAPVAVPKLSGFDKSHQNLLTTKVGTITPLLCDELIPGSRVNLKLALSASLPPLASETFMRCSIKCEAFFVPMRLLCGSFQNFFTDQPRTIWTNGTPQERKAMIPYIIDSTATAGHPSTWASKFTAVGSLADYLGMRSPNSDYLATNRICALPFLAYHKIYNDWYRNTLVQREVFAPYEYQVLATPSLGARCAGVSPFEFFSVGQSDGIWNSDDMLSLCDGAHLYDLRQRNFGLDYFTTATPNPQQGSAMSVSFATSGATGSFTIGDLRASNSMQQFKERNNLLGNLYVEQLYGRYGVRPSDGIAQRSLYLGRGEFEVYSKGIYQTAPSSDDTGGVFNPTNNPFADCPGARFGSAYASGENFIVNGFEAKEPGYLFVLATLVPRVTYATGVDKYLTHYTANGSITDMANPILQNVGPQPIYSTELTGVVSIGSGFVFGYTDRYAEFKTKSDSLHGLLRDGQSLESFALQRSFPSSGSGSNPVISDSFLKIPTNYLDQVSAVGSTISNYGCWIDSYIDYKVSMPLSKYSLPSLQDPAYEHGRTIVVSKGGSKL